MRVSLKSLIRLFPLSVCLYAAGSNAQNAGSGSVLTPEAAADLARVFAPAASRRVTFMHALTLNSLRVGVTGEAKPSCILSNVHDAPTNDFHDPRDVYSVWHCLGLNALAVDHIPSGDPGKMHQRYFGPHRASYAMAMLHLAMFEAANAFQPEHPSWIDARNKPVKLKDVAASIANINEAAVIAATAHRMLTTFYPYLKGDGADGLDKTLKDTQNAILAKVGGANITGSTDFGNYIADQILFYRRGDNSDLTEPVWDAGYDPKPEDPDFTPNDADDFVWTKDPVSKISVALGGHWGEVTPFVLEKFKDYGIGDAYKNKKFYLGPPPRNMAVLRAVAGETRTFGGDPWHQLSSNDFAKYYQGVFWSYDGTAGICAPVRLYNQIADTVLNKAETYQEVVGGAAPGLGQADASATTVENIAHYYNALNLGMADAGVVTWFYKYKYKYWRPVTGIRALDYVPTSSTGDLLSEKLQWGPVWFPFGAQNTNAGAGLNLTPPFPAYPSGHSVFGGAFFKILKGFIKEENKQGFDFQSDELNGDAALGKNIDAYNFERCKAPAAGSPQPPAQVYNAASCTKPHFSSFEAASQQNSDSRIWLGVHWRFDTDSGKTLGESIGDAVFNELSKPYP